MSSRNNSFFLCGVFSLFCVSLLSSCNETTPGGKTYPDGMKYIKDFHVTNFLQTNDMIEEDNLALYVDYSTCIAEGMKSSSFYVKLLPSFVEATKSYHSIQGNQIKKEEPTDTYNRLLNIEEVNYADLKSAAEEIANGNTEAALLTDGEYYIPTKAGANPNNPYLAKAFKTWMSKGHDIYIISEPYVELYNGQSYDKKRFYFLFTDARLKNNIFKRITETVQLENFPDVQLFHLSADHPNVMAEGYASKPNDMLAATVVPYGLFEIQDWTIDWKGINNYIIGAVNEQTGEPLPNGDVVISGLKIDRNSFGGYKITDVDIKVYDMNAEYMDFYAKKEAQEKIGPLDQELTECPHFLMVDHKEFAQHGIINLYFDVMNLDNAFLKYGKPYNYFKIDFFITQTENVFSRYASMFTFDLLGKPGVINSSVVTSVEQCLVDNDLQNQMKHTPIYTIYVKSNNY